MGNTTGIRSIHFIGVGGVGMSGIASIACAQGMRVTGSDIRSSPYTDHLAEIGIRVFIGNKASNIPSEVDVVVVSTAILDNNEELIEAKRRSIPIWHRAKMLAYLGCKKKTLAVAGTHGKTTTSSMLASTLDALDANPTFLIGGIVDAYNTNAHAGSGEYYVIEADESDKSFLELSPYAAIVTNIEADHLDHYVEVDEIYDMFSQFVAKIPENGLLVVCNEDKNLVNLAKQSGRNVISYGFGNDCQYAITSYSESGFGCEFSFTTPSGKELKAMLPQNPGRHNALNALSVIALAEQLGYSASNTAKCLSSFSGVRRRFDKVGQVHGVCVVDDYAHHPTEIAATINAARGLDFNRVHVLFQPHRYSRLSLFTDVLRSEFSQAFNNADTVCFMDVYAAGETPIPGVSGKTFLDVVLDANNHTKCAYASDRRDVPAYMASCAQPGDIILTMGAGDVTYMGKLILDALDTIDKKNLTYSSVSVFS